MRDSQLTLDLGHVTSHAEDDFLVSEGNELAVRHLFAFQDWSAPLTLLVGPPKSGKSHLARIWLERANAIQGTPYNLEQLATDGGTQPVLLEDADSGAFPEQGVFHLINQSLRDARPILMTARAEPEQWPLETNDVRSRVRLAARFTMMSANDTQLSHMLVKLFADRQIKIDPKILHFLIKRMERSSQDAVMLVETLDRLALSRRSAITRPLAAEALAICAKSANEDETPPGIDDGDTQTE